MKYSNISKLEIQLCFSLYACSKEIVRHYKHFLDSMVLTYGALIIPPALPVVIDLRSKWDAS